MEKMEKSTGKTRMSTYTLVLCSMFTALVAVGAFIQIPVPYMDYFTLQFGVVLLAGMILGPKYGSLSVAVYVLLGLIGLPIFAAGGGFSYVLRPSFGYLLGFIAAAFVTGLVCHRGKAGFGRYLLGAMAGFGTTYLIGLAYKYCILNFYLHTPATWLVVLASCFPLDMPGDLLLCILSALIGPRFHKWAGRKARG